MADVQTENGYTRIANQILEEIPQFKFNGTELRVIMAIWRYTYGFQRKEHEISINFLSDATGVDGSRVKKVLKELIKTNVILVVKEATFNSSRVLSFNKNFKEWEVEKDTRGQKQPQASKKTRTQGSKSAPTQGSNFTPKKESIKESIKENECQLIFDHYISKDIIRHRNFDADMKRVVKSKIKKYGVDELKTVIDNYSIVLHGEEYYFNHKYTLMDLMREKDIRQFGSEADPLYNFLKDKSRKVLHQQKEEYTLDDQLSEVKGYLELGREYFARKDKEKEYDALLKERERLEQLRDSQGQSTAI